MRGHSLGRVFAAGFLVACATQCGVALASPESDRLIGDGIAKLQANLHKDALQMFSQALVADPKDGRAAFYQGYVLNRLGQFGPAYAAFEDMRKLGVSHPEADYEEGWAALATGRWERAIALLEPYEKANPTNGKASEFLGRAYMAVGRLDDSEAALNRAMARDGSVKPNALYFLAELSALRGDRTKTADTLGRLAREAPISPIGVALGNEARREMARQEEDKPWSVYAAPGFGYNSNVIALSHDIIRPTDITKQDSWFFQLDAGGEYRFKILPASTLTAGIATSYDNYFDVNDANTVLVNPYLTYRHALFTDITGVLTFTGDYANVGGSGYRSGYTVRPSAVVQTPVPNLGVEIFYSYSDFDYKAPQGFGPLAANPTNFDRDSTVNSTGLRAIFDIPDVSTSLDGGVARIWNSAKGGDFDFRALQFSLGASSRLPWEITASAALTYTHYFYDNPNSLAPTTPSGPLGFGFERKDETTGFSARLNRPIWGPAEGFVQYDQTHNESNILVYKYHQHQMMGGLVARF